MACKKCKLNISGDCMLTTGICVFCHYKIDSWDSNGELVTKEQATEGIGWFEFSPCPHCYCMTYTIKGKCGKCKGRKSQ
jgi:hypothetical protein